MTKLISASALIDKLTELSDRKEVSDRISYLTALCLAAKEIDGLPAVAVSSRQIAKWYIDRQGVRRCTNCLGDLRSIISFSSLEYCPMCGAKMIGRTTEFDAWIEQERKNKKLEKD